MPDEEIPDELESRRRKKETSSAAKKCPVKAKTNTNKPGAANHYIPGRRLFRAGENVTCEIVAPEQGGYKVVLQEGNYPAFMPTDQKYEPGDVVEAQFVCENGARFLLQPKLSARSLRDRNYTGEEESDR